MLRRNRRQARALRLHVGIVGENRLHLAAKGVGEFRIRADRIGHQRAAAIDEFAQLLSFGGREAKRPPAVHEHQMIFEQRRVGNVDQSLLGAHADLQLAGRRFQQMRQRRWSRIAAAGMTELRDVELASREIILGGVIDFLLEVLLAAISIRDWWRRPTH